MSLWAQITVMLGQLELDKLECVFVHCFCFSDTRDKLPPSEASSCETYFAGFGDNPPSGITMVYAGKSPLSPRKPT